MLSCSTIGNFLDSIILHSTIAGQIIATGLRYELPIRGAINYGVYKLDNNVSVGPAIDEVAVEYADWIGAFLTPSAYLQVYDAKIFSPSLIEYDVPTKTLKIATLSVKWCEFFDRVYGKELFYSSLHNLGPITPDIYSTIDNTMKFCKKITNY